ncbi:hypothetical protein [Heyndrickxia sporothermodurans]|uniref:hypothetical protein n=1 Tax=Heyndrickxia sporothermodurans TaxID=46224 RepID=UPI00192C5037|nr:hypothetical protein [Heyndrickxia sporothermodurans]MBL5805333.1 hypothetical protein [Heyndrickxia sporothermodurans]MBL5858963.1 hypothetical protein [Heyndrickxia sporothermodurans]MBL5871914.1 hypothetical protein [Heyndrickxia sporothermodurans]MBL7248846.1 hypothetical protein [Heyndrickxia sporothermodurans]
MFCSFHYVSLLGTLSSIIFITLTVQVYLGAIEYVVRDENDLNRIPFLDNTVDKNGGNAENLRETEYNEEVKVLFSLLKQYDSENIKLKDYQVGEIVNTLMQGMEIDYEHSKVDNKEF